MIPPAPTVIISTPSMRQRPPRGPAACSCMTCVAQRAPARARAEAELAALMAARADERQRIVSMLSRRSSSLEDSGDLAESAALSDAVHAIEQLVHIGLDGDLFVAVELEQ